MRRVCIEKCECLANLFLAAMLSQRRSWLLQGRDGVLPLTRARRCSAWQDKSPRELRERLVAHSSSAVALIVFIGTYFAAAAIYVAVITLAVDARARTFKPFSLECYLLWANP